MKKLLLSAVACGLILMSHVFAQPGCPAVTIPQKGTNGNYALPCGSICGTLTAVPFAGAQTTDYSVSSIPYAPPFAYNTGTQVLVNIDDTWSQAINLPFRFCFYGTGYTSVIIGSNGAISFDVANANTFNNWNIPGPAPLGNQRVDLRNSIMAPWQDLDPTNRGQIFYELGGVAPCRYLKVSWYQAPMFGDPNSVNTSYSNTQYRQTQQIVLYETTNVIDIYIQQKGFLAGWNGGLAIEGIQNANGTAAVTVPGRNATQWTATNDAYRFIPIGAPNYTVAWYLASNNTLLGNSTTLNVCPTTSGTKYISEVTYNSCGVTGVVVRDSVAVVFSGLTAALDSVKQITCPGANNGAVYASFNSTTTAVLSYGWSPGGAGQTSLTGLGPGTYTFTVTDSIGCSKSLTATINTPQPFTVNVPDTTITACNPGATATLISTINGGTPGYTYSWSNAATTPTITAAAGTYTLTVTDAANCTASDGGTITINAGAGVVFNPPTITNATCGQSNGSISVSSAGGVNPVTYTWSNGLPNGTTQTGLAANTYSVTATDANGCSASAQYTVTTTNAISFGPEVIANATCAGNNGSIVVTVIGATDPITYSWSGGLPNNDTVTGLAAATYTVTATDLNGCSASASYTVGQAGPISFGPSTVKDATCINDGSIAVTLINATDPITYNWSGGLPDNDTVTGLSAGVYTVTATDANSCTASASFTIVKGPAITFNPPVIVNANCGQSNGSIVVSLSNATDPITYIWSNPLPANDTVTGLAAGTYDVTATDVNGCSVTASYTITDIPLSFGTPQITDEGCTTLGSIIVSVVGAIDPVDYTWSGGQPNNDTLVNLSAGTYDVTAVDANGCSATASYTVGTAPNTIAFGAPVITDVTCNGGNDGSITANTTGGNGTVTFVWNTTPQQTTAAITGLTAGNYAVTATDATGCSVSATYDVNEPTAITLGAPVITDAACLVGGTVTVVATGGTGTLTYSWSNGDSGILADSLPAGTVNLTVTDANGCSVTATYNIGSAPNTLTFDLPTIVNVSCNGGNDGSITATTTGGSGTVTFVWSTTPAQTTATISGLTAGAYSVTITDSLGCSASTTYNVAEPAAIVIGQPTIVPATCLVGGSVTVTATGGTGTLTYDWSNGDSGNTADSISSGSVSLTVTDANGCSVTASYNVPVSSGITLTGSQTNITCNGANDGTITLIVSGGTYPYTYTWNPVATANDSTATGLAPGTYDVTVEDNGGCSASASYTITEPAAIVLGNPLITDETCTEGGTVTVTATGGTGTLTYSWSNGDNGTLADSLTAGTVSLTVTDANGCSVTASYNVGSVPNTLAFGQPTIVNVSCNGGNDGSITATTTGGTGTVTFAWSTTPAQTTATISGLTAGAYSVTITDSLGCSASATYNVTEPTAIVIGQPTIVPATCLVGGSVTVTATGGTGVLTYDWSNGDNGNTVDSISSGSVSLTVTDANGCSATASYNVPVSSGITLTGSQTNITCNGANNGTITLVVSGGTYPYTYTWNPVATANDSTATGLSAGTYSVTVNDNGGCSATASYTITEPSSITLGNPVITNQTCTTGGSVTVTATGGTGTLTYNWSNGDNGTTADNLNAGAVNLTVTDANGCSITATYNIIAVGSAVTFGQPTLTQPTCNGGTNGSITVTTSGGLGTVVYTWNPGSSTTATLSGIGAGTYSVTATDSLGCTATASYTLNQPAAIDLGNAIITQVTCQRGGSVTINPTGGVAPLTINWSNGDSGNTADSLVAGTTTVTVTDANSCSVTGSYNISNSGATITFGNPIINNVSCNGANDGSITVNATGGTGAITYTWTNPATVGTTVVNLAPGQYTVVATDQGGCSASATYTITQPAPLVVVVGATPLVCTGGNNGTAEAFVTGGTAGYTYTWNPNNGTGSTINNLPFGIVSVTVTDANGCTAKDDSIISQSTPLSYFIRADQPDCSPFGTETIVPRDGFGAVRIEVAALGVDTTVSRVGGDSTLIIPNIPTGNYNFTLTDALGCTTTGNFFVDPGATNQAFNVTTDSTSCFGDGFNDGGLKVIALTPANAPYFYSLDGTNFQDSGVFNNLTAGTYNITVRNSKGCLDTVTATVEQPAQLVVDATPATTTTTAGTSTELTVSVSNFTNPVYTWTPSKGLSNTDSSSTTATVSETTVFYVRVSEDSNARCFASDSLVIIINSGLKMPNAFTPNNDGKNDSYGPVNGDNSALTITAFRIYNRWGQEVHNATENWNGKFKGEDQPAGTYIYYISVKTPDEANPGKDKTLNDQGSFTLLR